MKTMVAWVKAMEQDIPWDSFGKFKVSCELCNGLRVWWYTIEERDKAWKQKKKPRNTAKSSGIVVALNGAVLDEAFKHTGDCIIVQDTGSDTIEWITLPELLLREDVWELFDKEEE